MSHHPNRFRLSPHGVLLALISAAFANPGFAASGKIDFAVGTVTATGADGQPRQLTKGAEVGTGDRIVSNTDGRAQIRFPDGAYVSLQPNTDFSIKDYQYEGKTDGSEKALFGLLKGALRTVTGLVGRINRDAYKITTPTATVGIRGTGGLIFVGTDGTTKITGTSGVWIMTNNAGTIEIPAGTSGTAGPNQNQPPQQTSQGTNIPPPQQSEQQQTYTQGDNRDSQGNALLVTPLQSGPDYAVAFSAFGGEAALPASAVFDDTGRLTQFTFVGEGTETFSLAGTHGKDASGTKEDFGTDGVLAWGRWIGNVNNYFDGFLEDTFAFGPNEGLHYVVGTPTPYASLPTGVTYTYNLIGASFPTFSNGASPPGTLTSGTLTGNFTTNTVDVSLTGTTSAGNFNAMVSNMSIYNNNGGAYFSGGPGSCSGTLCSESGAYASGFFAGSGASHAGIAYTLPYTTQGSSLSGVAAFKR